MLNTIVNVKKLPLFIETFCVILLLSSCNIIPYIPDQFDKETLRKAVSHSDTNRKIPGNKKDLVKEIQSLLNKLGYEAGPVDGLTGKKTRSAIRKFQIESGMQVDGEASPKILLALREHRIRPSTTDEEAPDPRPECENASNKSEWSDTFNIIKKAPTSVVVDCTCKEFVEPFEITSNVEAAANLVYEASVAGAKQWLNNILKDNYKPDIELKEVKKAVKNMNWMPLEIEKKYGEIIHEDRSQDADLKFLPKNSPKQSTKSLYEKANKILAQLISLMPTDQPYEFNVLIYNSLEVNAEAIPGGTVYLSRGALDEDLAYFVLGHELAHVSKRHTTKAFQSRLIDTVDTVEELKELISDKSELTSLLDRTFALNEILVKYSQAQELQSDACAVRMLISLEDVEIASEIPRYTAHLAEKAEKKPDKAPKNTKTVDFLGKSYRVGEVSSHPAYPERIKNIGLMSNLMQQVTQ
ncbi:MAG: peptidoglycan-binding protein [Methylococcales bacterium]